MLFMYLKVANWMTNMRKRHVIPILNGCKAPKTKVHYTFLNKSPNECNDLLASAAIGSNQCNAFPGMEMDLDNTNMGSNAFNEYSMDPWLVMNNNNNINNNNMDISKRRNGNGWILEDDFVV